jgi:hypothetical protein
MHRLIPTLGLRSKPLRLFFRNDDAGWAQDRLDALLGVFCDSDTPIDLAVIPAVLTAEGADLLKQWQARHAGIGLHQHGYAHTNHEPEGARKCEFGPSRPVERQCADIAMGRDRLAGLLGTVDPIFTPPWNRCARETVARLPRLGFSVYSDDGGAVAQDGGPLHLPIDLDWERERRRGSLPEALAALVSRPGDLAGIMLHHATMDDAAMAAFSGFLRQIRSHRNVEFVSMRDIKELLPCAN